MKAAYRSVPGTSPESGVTQRSFHSASVGAEAALTLGEVLFGDDRDVPV